MAPRWLRLAASEAARLSWRRWPRRSAGRTGLNVVGYFHGGFGLGEAARLLARDLEAEGDRVWRVAVERDIPGRQDPSLCPQAGRDGAGHTTIFVANPDRLGVLLLRFRSRACVHAPRRIAYWFWEQTFLPASWRRWSRCFDEIWVPSGSLERLMRAELPGRTVRRVRPSWASVGAALAGHPRVPKRERLTVFSAYDRGSSFWRKRPDLAWQIARRARDALRTEGVDLAFHLHVLAYEPAVPSPEEAALLGEVERAPWAELSFGPLSRDEYLDRVASSHLFLSTACAEGLGLGLMEARALGLRVLAPAWSGIAEDEPERFTPLPYALAAPELGRGSRPYRPRGQWAYTRIAAASDVLRDAALEEARSARAPGAAGASAGRA